jgi:ABC-type transport system involved in multi-copper enzyme maturation permease subunit
VTPPVAITIAALTLKEARRKRVVWALVALTIVLVALSGWGFAKLRDAESSSIGSLTSGEARLVTSQLLNLVMFGMSLLVALGTAFLAGPTLGGELDTGIAHSTLARPIRRTSFLAGKWLGLATFGAAYIVVAGLAQFTVVRVTADYWPPRPGVALGLLALQTIVLLTLALFLSSAISPLASGIVAVGLFGSAWVAGVVGGIGEVLGNDAVARVGSVSRMLLPTDGLWRGAMNAIQDPSALTEFGRRAVAFPFLSTDAVTPAYLIWVAAWIAIVGTATAVFFSRRDL